MSTHSLTPTKVGWLSLLLSLLLLLCTPHQVGGFCVPEPDLCTRCDDKAECKTSKPSFVVPKNLPEEIQSLKIVYKGDHMATLNSAMFKRYTKLVNITISGTNIHSLGEGVFRDLRLLEKVTVSKTALSEMPNGMFANHSAIKSLKLSKNQLTDIPYHLFDDLPNLEFLDLNFNNITLKDCSSIGVDFAKLSKLSSLLLGNLKVKDSCKHEIDAQFFQPVQRSLTFLNLTVSNIYDGNQTIFKNFEVLETLDISAAENLSSCPSNAVTLFENLPDSLVQLVFRRWRSQDEMRPECMVDASTLAPLRGLPRLKYLDIKYSNDIFGNVITKSVFDGFSQLTELNIGYCRFAVIEGDAFDGCPKLKRLLLAGNPLSNRPISLFSSANVSRLEYLKLTRAQIYSDYTESYQASLLLLNAPLKVISLNRNLLAKIPVFTYKDIRFDTLEEIRLDHNFLTELYVLQSDISFGDQCRYLPNLKKVSFSHNNIVNISSLSGCYNLQSLDISYNRIATHWDEVNKQEIAKLTKLRVLDLSFNEITRLPKNIFSKMESLEVLRLEGNYILRVDNSQFSNNYFLKTLDLTENSLSKFEASYVQHLHDLRELLLADNGITLIDPKLIAYFDNNKNSVTTFSIIGNSLSCACPQGFFQKWIKQTNLIPSANELVCHGPTEKLREKKVYQYIRDDFYCDHQQAVVISCSILGGILGALLLGLPCYKYRWYLLHIRIVLRAVFFQVSQIQINQTCLYDAYVMYNAASVEDQRWVVSDLRKALELDNAQDTTKLYIHDRDALPGSEVFTEMISSMEKSRKIIIILTNSYLKSSLCQGQADLAGRESYGRKVYQPNRIMVVVRERLDEEAIEAPFTSLLTENVVDMYNCGEGEVTRVWNRIRKFLKKPRYEFVKPNKYEPADDVEMQ